MTCRHVLGASALAILVLAAMGRSQDAPAEPKVAGLKLTPVDESASDPSFLAFKRELEKVVRVRDQARLFRDFLDVDSAHALDDEGPDALANLWERLEDALRLGIVREQPPSKKFIGPSLAMRFPSELLGECGESEYVVIAGKEVAIRSGPSASAKVIDRLSYQLGKTTVPSSEGNDPSWRRITTPGGQVGFVQRRFAVGPYDVAIFSNTAGRWVIEAGGISGCAPESNADDVAWVRQKSKYEQTLTLIKDFKIIVYPGTTLTGFDDGGNDSIPPGTFDMQVWIGADEPGFEDLKLPELPMATEFLRLDIHRADPPIAVFFPNTKRLPVGTTDVQLFSYDPETKRTVVYGTGTVSTDGKQIVPDSDPAHPGHLYGPTHIEWLGALLPAKFRTNQPN